jgi:hypothetical protein
MATMLRRSILISWFVAAWLILFNYESLRANYLVPLTGRPLPKTRLLFPPAGWIMFFNIDPSYGFAEVYGTRQGQPEKLDPHDIFETDALGYDNIHRNVLVGVLYRDRAEPFCRFLRRKFPDYTGFAVVYAQYPDFVNSPERLARQVAYRCQ